LLLFQLFLLRLSSCEHIPGCLAALCGALDIGAQQRYLVV